MKNYRKNCTEDGTCPDDLDLPASLLAPQAPTLIAVKNHIYLYDEISPVTARNLIHELHETAITLISNSFENNTEIPPIVLHINSYGGSVNDALAIVQAVKDIQNGAIHKIGNIPIKVPVNTMIEGECDSASSLIACVGSRRYISKYALSLIHDVRQIGGIGGKTEEIDVQAKNLAMFKEKFYDIYLEHSKLSKDKLAEICGKEDYSTPQELLEWGLVDEIV